MDGIILEVQGVLTPLGHSDLESFGVRWFRTSLKWKIQWQDRAIAAAVLKRAHEDGKLTLLQYTDAYCRLRIEHKQWLMRHYDVMVIALNHCLMSLKPFEELEDPV